MKTSKLGLRERLKSIWIGMNNRCKYPSQKYYPNYGGRGIKVKWANFATFKYDMEEAYSQHVLKFGEKNTTLDRIDNDGDYSKHNCRWATRSEQMKKARHPKTMGDSLECKKCDNPRIVFRTFPSQGNIRKRRCLNCHSRNQRKYLYG